MVAFYSLLCYLFDKGTNAMNLLAIHTATELCAVAVLVNGKSYERNIVESRIHGQKILFMVDDLLQEAGVLISHIDAFIVIQGPGSFTGIRIGISIINAFAFSHNKPVIPISTLQFYAQSAASLFDIESVSVALDARMDEIYWEQFVNEQGVMTSLAGPKVLSLIKLSFDVQQITNLGVGNGFIFFEKSLKKWVTKVESEFIPKLIDLFPLIESKLQHKMELISYKPLYCRNKVV